MDGVIATRKCKTCNTEKPLIDENFAKKSAHFERECRACKLNKKAPVPVVDNGEKRTCKTCGAEKPLNFIHFGNTKKGAATFKSTCRECERKHCKEYKEKNKTKVSEYNTKWKKNHKTDVTKYNTKYTSERKATDPAFKIRLQNRIRIIGALKGSNKSKHTAILLGCDHEMFMMWLEYRFVEGMTFDNYGPVWELDHVIPCASFDMTKPESQAKCFHWSNYQPLFAKDNTAKCAKIDDELIIMQAIKVREFLEVKKDELKNFKYTLL